MLKKTKEKIEKEKKRHYVEILKSQISGDMVYIRGG